jgi:hypothetical protein
VGTLFSVTKHVIADSATKENEMAARPIYQIAREIRQDWTKPYFGAVPYLDAMGSLNSIHDNYGWDDGKSVVLYFLSNATTWRGETARRIKTELKGMLKG